MEIQNNRPMSYDSSKILLQYLEANVRFQLSSRVLSIRKREKLVPLKIHTLKFYQYGFLINKTEYTLGTYRNYPIGTAILRNHQDDNLKGGVSWDLDEHGFRLPPEQDFVTADDVVIKDEILGGRAEQEPDDEEEGMLESQLEVYKHMVAKKSDQEVDPLDRNHRFYFVIYQDARLPIKYFQQRVNDIEASLAPYRCRRNGVQRPYSTSIQLTVISPDRTYQIWHRPSVHPVQGTNFKLHEAQKQLADFLFGNRTCIVRVKNFEVGFPRLPSEMIVRLPPNFQIRIQNRLTIPHNAPATCDALQAIIHNSSYPLERFETSKSNIYSLTHPIIAGARKLVFKGMPFFDEFQEILQFQNRNIYMGFNCFTPDEHIILLRNWIDNRREIGASFISQLEEEATILGIFALAKEQLNGFDDGERCVKIPMSNLSQIKVSYKHLKKRRKRLTEWMLIIKVVAV